MRMKEKVMDDFIAEIAELKQQRDHLESENAKQAEMLNKVIEQCDELLAALDAAVTWALPMREAPVDARAIWFDPAFLLVNHIKRDPMGSHGKDYVALLDDAAIAEVKP